MIGLRRKGTRCGNYSASYGEGRDMASEKSGRCGLGSDLAGFCNIVVLTQAGNSSQDAAHGLKARF
jgi:hypothetical protein